MKKLFTIILLFGGFHAATAQDDSQPARKFAFLVGSWHGTASVNLGPNSWKTIQQSEDVSLRLNDNVMYVSGTGTEDQKVVFEAIGLMSFNKTTKKYNFRAYRENGMTTDAYVEFKGEKWFEWGFQLANGAKMRYNTQVRADGQWHELGEYSPDGVKWYKNFEMTLTKAN
ncbi:hypothetical protein LZD49_19920 [Dyadobacter sp. CY261]|uniref:hypothetical protein n=1 Tax=Dyadobacter sp. CY261 TaxID=2907203 RepID=UPI001F2C357B|nr:hypothetical protein [Dyadobacter sp. CY261]MCF0072758.1 hypothetical protein [Dyadobacter sp. CY261]